MGKLVAAEARKAGDEVGAVITTKERIDGALTFLRHMTFARLDEFATLHRQLTIPTLFIWGADDPTFPEPKARAMLGPFQSKK